MAKMIDEISVFFPTLNEEGNIKNVVDKAKNVLERVAGSWEIIIIEDGSTDNTPEIADEIAKTDKRIRVIHHKVNRGYGGALKTGFENAKYEWVAFTDSDGQFDFSELEKFINRKNQGDLILGYRKKRADSLARKIFTFGWATLARLLLGLKAKDYSCGFKMIKKKVYEAVQPLVGEEKVTQIEMLVKARKKGFRIIEVGVNHFPRVSGQPTGAKLRVVIKSIIDMFKLWGKLHDVTRRELIIILLILGVGAFLRLYKIDEYMTFLGDEGRDVLIVRRLLVNADPILIGPGTSVGNMYLGPLYYYLIAPALLLANFSPVGPAIFIALLGVMTIALVWWVAREWFGVLAGLAASILYAVSPTVIIHSHSSWNPNIMPFFSLLTMYSLWKAWKQKEYKWLVVMGASLAFVLQSHYLGVLLLPVIVIFLVKSHSPKNYLIYALAVFLFLMSPLVLFDMRHNFMNLRALKTFIFDSEGSFSFNFVSHIWPNFKLVIIRLLAGRNVLVGTVLSLVFILSTLGGVFKKNKILTFWLGFGILGLSLYRYEIYDHYFGFLFPGIYLLFAGLIQFFSGKLKKWTIPSVALMVLVLLAVNLAQNPFRFPGPRQLERARAVSEKILEESKGERFNLAVLAERNYEDGYGYFLEKAGVEVLHADIWDKKTISDQLFAVCERRYEDCKPTTDAKAEIANFGMSEIEDEWQVMGVTIYRLVHKI